MDLDMLPVVASVADPSSLVLWSVGLAVVAAWVAKGGRR